MELDLSRPLCCFDIESTGLDPERDRIVELGLVRLMPDGTRRSLQRRFDPGIDIPEAATRIHGIRNDDVRGLFGEPPFARSGAEVLEFIGDADLCGFNAIAFDLPLWLAECRRHGLDFAMEGRFIVDAKVIFDGKEPAWDRFLQGPRNLNNAVLHFCGRDRATEFKRRDDDGEGDWRLMSIDEQNRHSAVKDADATLDVLLAQLIRYRDLPRSVPELHGFCANAVAARAAGAPGAPTSK